MPEVFVPPERCARWVDNFRVRHGETSLSVGEVLRGEAEDGAWFVARLPFEHVHAGAPTLEDFVSSAPKPPDWGVLLVRKGGFAVARMSGATVLSSKVGQRHVQGRSKAGGQSQQRFARRRDNQARAAWHAAAEHAAQHLAQVRGPVMVAGDRQGIDEVLADPRLRGLNVQHLVSTAGEPRRAALEQAISEALALRVEVHNGPGTP